jgi:nicotinamide-nucleotide amidase
MSNDLATAANAVLDRARAEGLRIATAESCTGGLIAANLTDIPGSSDVFERGFVTYSNDSKTELLGVPADLIDENGAVSEPVAHAMAEGALARSRADIAVAVTGIAGPGGGSAEKPVGLVFIGAAKKGDPTIVQRHVFPGDRADIRQATVLRALELLLNLAGD